MLAMKAIVQAFNGIDRDTAARVLGWAEVRYGIEAQRRDDAAAYRKALSAIAYRLDNGGLDSMELRSIVTRALIGKIGKGLRTKSARKGVSPLHGSREHARCQ